jgi:hypothetical protein
MADFDETNRGVLFKNDKGDNPNRPDYTGKCNIAGKEYRMAAWIRDSQTGKKFMSINFSDLGEQKTEQPAGQEQPVAEDLGDELPFKQDR